DSVRDANGRTNWALEEDGWLLRVPLGNELSLTTAERGFLLRLCHSPGDPVSRAELISSLGGDPRCADPHKIDVLVNRLRRKAGLARMNLPLHSVRGKGYALTTQFIRTGQRVSVSREAEAAAPSLVRARSWTTAPRRPGPTDARTEAVEESLLGRRFE